MLNKRVDGPFFRQSLLLLDYVDIEKIKVWMVVSGPLRAEKSFPKEKKKKKELDPPIETKQKPCYDTSSVH